jgi:hypothetical protein
MRCAGTNRQPVREVAMSGLKGKKLDFCTFFLLQYLHSATFTARTPESMGFFLCSETTRDICMGTTVIRKKINTNTEKKHKQNGYLSK